VYNVIRLDEADAKLDDLRRRSYLSMVVDRMEEIGISDCFAVTHNNEFDNVAADIILLSGAEQSINSLQNKNVIFSV
jgi:ABC-type siderophore export system fused ATPase/permease subunit